MADEKLQNPKDWDFEHAERRRPQKNVRAVVSVAFAREDFERLSEHAQRLGLKTSEFIRVAALGRLRGGLMDAHFVLRTSELRDDAHFGPAASRTGSLSSRVERERPEVETAAAAG